MQKSKIITLAQTAASIAAKEAPATKDLGLLVPENALFFACDVQERFRPLIKNMPSVIHVSQSLIKAAKIYNIPVIVTEHCPSTYDIINALL